jgi:chemotaxis protein histidine kinase CheA
MSSDDAFDDEIVEIFVEEVAEVLSQIDDNLPIWEANVANEVALKEVRRAFHTLKGSGRMVQALDIGELAWAVESMLNRVIDNTLKIQPAMFEVVKETRSAVPAMLKAFRNKQAAALSGVNFTQLIDQAKDIVAGKVVTPLRATVNSQLSDEILAVHVMPAVGNTLDMVEIEALKERIGELSVSINEIKRNFVTMSTQLDSISAQVKMMPKGLDPIAINKQLRNADQEIQELKYFIKASSEKMMADTMDQQRRLDAKVDRELRIVNGLSEKVDEDVQKIGAQLKAEFGNVVKMWALGAVGVSVIFTILFFAIFS